MPAGEGYECTVTVDDEDSKVIIFDNWKQVSCTPSSLRPSSRVSLSRCSGGHLPSKPHFTSMALTLMDLMNCKSNSFSFCDGQIICVYSSVKCVFMLCFYLRVQCCGGSPAGEAVLFEALSFGKMEITLVSLICVEYVSVVNQKISVRARICATLHEQPFQLCES